MDGIALALDAKTTSNIKYTWLVLLPLCVFVFFDFIQLNMMNSMGPFLVREYAITPRELGFISSLLFYVNLILLFPAGILLDSHSTKWLVAISIAITCVGISLFAAFPSVGTMIAWRALSGFCGAFSYLACIKILSSYLPKKMLGFLIGATGIIIMFAGFTAQYPLILSIHRYGIPQTLWFDCVAGLVTIFIVLTLINEKKSNVKRNKFSFSIDPAHLKPTNWLIAAYACLNNFPFFVLAALWGDLYLLHVHNFHIAIAAFITSMIFIGNMLGAPLLGFISDRMKTRKPLMIAMGIVYLLTIFTIMYISANNNHLLFMGLFFILGIATGAQTLAYAAVVDENPSENTAKATSLLSFLSIGGAAIAQPLFGWLATISKKVNYQNGMYLIAFGALISIFLAIRYYKQHGDKL